MICLGILKIRGTTMATKAKHNCRSHKTNGRIVFKSKDKAHKGNVLDNILYRIEKEIKED